MLELKEDTASQTIILGPFIDDTDGKTPKTGLSIANTDILLNKHGGTTLGAKNSGGATEISGGWYYCTLDATDTNTAGRLVISVKKTGALIVFHEFMVRPTNLYDSLVDATDKLQVDSVEISSATAAADSVESNIGNLDAAVSTRAPEAGGNIAAILADTGTDGVVVAAGSKTGYSLSADQSGVTVGTVNTLTGHTAQTGDSFARIGATGSGLTSLAQASVCTVGRLGELDAANLPADIDAIKADTDSLDTTKITSTRAGYLDELAAANIPADIDSITAKLPSKSYLSGSADADGGIDSTEAGVINDQVADVLKTDTVTLPGQIAPPATPTMEGILGWLFKIFRNKKTQTSTLWSLFNDVGDTVDSKATVSDSGGTSTVEEVVSGP